MRRSAPRRVRNEGPINVVVALRPIDGFVELKEVGLAALAALEDRAPQMALVDQRFDRVEAIALDEQLGLLPEHALRRLSRQDSRLAVGRQRLGHAGLPSPLGRCRPVEDLRLHAAISVPVATEDRSHEEKDCYRQICQRRISTFEWSFRATRISARSLAEIAVNVWLKP